MPSTLVAVHPQPVDPAAVIALEVEMHPGERGHRAGGAEQMEAPGVPDGRSRPERSTKASSKPRHMRHHGGEDFAA